MITMFRVIFDSYDVVESGAELIVSNISEEAEIIEFSVENPSESETEAWVEWDEFREGEVEEAFSVNDVYIVEGVTEWDDEENCGVFSIVFDSERSESVKEEVEDIMAEFQANTVPADEFEGE